MWIRRWLAPPMPGIVEFGGQMLVSFSVRSVASLSRSLLPGDLFHIALGAVLLLDVTGWLARFLVLGADARCGISRDVLLGSA